MNDTIPLAQPNFTRFSLLLAFAIPSSTSAVYIIYCYLRYSSIRKIFYYEIIILLTVLVLLKLIFVVTIALSYYARGYVSPQTNALCRFWQYFDYVFPASIVWCTAIFTIERYILVFQPHLLRFKRQKILFHYLPLLLSNIYLILFYIYGIIFLSCDEEILYNKHLCGSICLESHYFLSIFNWIVNTLLPVFLVIFSSLILLIRVLYTRRKMQRNLQNWSKNYKMIVQLLGIAFVYTIVWLPLSVVSLMFLTKRHHPVSYVESNLFFLTHLAELSMPTIIFVSSPEINRYVGRRILINIFNIMPVRTT